MIVTKEMIIGAVIDSDPDCAKIFHMHGMFCTSCPHSRSESIEDACAVHGIECSSLVNALNEYFADK